MSRALLLLLAACAPLDLHPVYTDKPGRLVSGTTEPPAVMFVLDKSGSMSAQLPGGTGCGTCTFPTCNEPTCPTRMGMLRKWTNEMLPPLSSEARWGLTRFPSDNVCGAPTSITVAIAPYVGSNIVLELVQSTTVGGGTPTANAVNFARSSFTGVTAEPIMLLVTDGLPNCNFANPNVCTDPALCKCTLNGGSCGTTVNDADPNNFCRRGCLDMDPSVDAIHTNTTAGIFTLVVGLGADFGSGDGAQVLGAMSRAGLEGQRCLVDADCYGAFACNPQGVCEGPALAAQDLAGLTAVTEVLRKKLRTSARCRWTLGNPFTAETLHVYLDGEEVSSGEAVLETPTRARLLGNACQRLLDQPELAPSFFDAPPP